MVGIDDELKKILYGGNPDEVTQDHVIDDITGTLTWQRERIKELDGQSRMLRIALERIEEAEMWLQRSKL